LLPHLRPRLRLFLDKLLRPRSRLYLAPLPRQQKLRRPAERPRFARAA